MNLDDKIRERQIKYYHHVIKCINLYIDGDADSLKNFLVALLKMGRGHVVLGDDFDPLVDAFKKQDVEMIQILRSKFVEELDKNEL